jgi:PiT family inorganic phosphate transporter
MNTHASTLGAPSPRPAGGRTSPLGIALFVALLSSGAVAFGIISLLPVELILQVGSKAGFAMVFALLIAAIVWILGTWWLGLPVSTTHVLSSGVAGTMAANRSGLQMATVRNLALAWVLTLPAAILLSGCLYWLFSHLF